jgi:hypothetical protein
MRVEAVQNERRPYTNKIELHHGNDLSQLRLSSSNENNVRSNRLKSMNCLTMCRFFRLFHFFFFHLILFINQDIEIIDSRIVDLHLSIGDITNEF